MSIDRAARTAGFFYLLTIIFGVFGELAATPGTWETSASLYRLGLAMQLTSVVCYAIVTVLLYELFEPLDRRLSLIAACISVIGLAVLAVADLALYSQSFHLHGQGYVVADVFFGLYCLLIGTLILRSQSIARPIGILMVLAGVCYVADSSLYTLAPAFESQLSSFILIPSLVGELALTLWLLLAGMKGETV